jgi:hypothetical protein
MRASYFRPTELITPAEKGGAVVNPRREVLKKPNGDVTVLEGQCLAEVPTCGVDTSCIGSKVAVGRMVHIKGRCVEKSKGRRTLVQTRRTGHPARVS